MAYEFTRAHPDLSVTVFDLPAVVEMSEHFQPQHADNRVSFAAGQFVKVHQSPVSPVDGNWPKAG